MSSEAIYNVVRALTHPYIGADFIYENQEYKVWQVSEVKTNQHKNIEPGKIIKVNADESFDVKVYDNVIRVLDYSKVFSTKKAIYL